MEIKLENWEEDALEGRLDRLGMAFIEFNEFNEFSIEYGINWGEPLIEGDMEDILEAKMNVSYKDYKVTSKDYFAGCPTMLNNEKAALAKCRSIWHEMKKKNDHQYLDLDFGPKNDKDEEGNKNSLYKNGVLPQKGYPLPEETVWKSYKDFCPGVKPQFVDDGASSNDCLQGDLGDCWFISAMGVCAGRDELLMGGRRGMEYDPEMIVDKEIALLMCNGIYPPIFHKFRARGLFCLRIFKNFNWIYIIIDDRVPVCNI